jgi:hypothetical protein
MDSTQTSSQKSQTLGRSFGIVEAGIDRLGVIAEQW